MIFTCISILEIYDKSFDVDLHKICFISLNWCFWINTDSHDFMFNYGPEGRPYSDQCVRPSVRPLFRPSQIIFADRVVVCVHSLLLRNYSTDFSNDDTNQLRKQRRHATYTSFWLLYDCSKGHKILRFCEFRCLTGSNLCLLLLRKYSTDFSNEDTNQLREQCRCAMYTSFWPWPLHDCRSRSQNTSILWI